LIEILLVGAFGAAAANGQQPSGPREEARDVSLIQLIATPERYEGQLVRVVGVAQFGQEESALYLHREDAELLRAANAVWLDVKQDYKTLAGAFVLAEGRFTAGDRGHLGAFAGELKNVRRLEKHPTRADLKRLRKEWPQ
jgi:hypothetical protein